MFARALTTAAASLALLSTVPAIAAPPAASRLSLSNARVGAPASGDESRLTGGVGGIAAVVIGLGIAALVVFAVMDETDDDDDSFPVSP